MLSKAFYAFESIFSDSPTLGESFGINFSFVAYTPTYLYRVKLTHSPFSDVLKLIGTLFPISF